MLSFHDFFWVSFQSKDNPVNSKSIIKARILKPVNSDLPYTMLVLVLCIEIMTSFNANLMNGI